PQVSLVVINTNGDTERFGSDLPTVRDPVDGYAGPLAGVLAGLQWASQQIEISHIVTVAADTPFFPISLVQKLLTKLVESNSEIVVAQSLGRNHPVFAIWSIQLENPLENWLQSGKSGKVLTFIEEFKHSFATFDDCLLKDPSPDPFFNVNRPDDLTRAHTIYEELNA
ncbi:MAG: NTP transferase domain-containing protein, partial [Cohaesibacteraceae bacterium]|nr:NTP transferase domain-containing protein [Cohaesibacteraceae bacterium]